MFMLIILSVNTLSTDLYKMESLYRLTFCVSQEAIPRLDLP